ncbi:glycosyltransferase family 2 protein [Pseudoprimorskyibacter insulae]|uniref:Spore coat polysaccharide biosynthesis protein SpsA n=1 Tax=Pseudoprimorskyibacter insulae TaxID=1695997 RepID=A0A2R8B0H9_9RHOB|nr:glycosyltransferase family 2 protein [Pseudoprimorskyibacter insulae]SPF81795.1 Spore coat polysaccharide biosynthesis protein SpsA [Pseudoprimorskyibacter insulae]
MSDSAAPKIAILLATYNGAACLQEQLDSLAAQSMAPALILVSDDNSADDTRDIVRAFGQANPALTVQLIDGPCDGAAQNFLWLLRHCPDWVDYAAFCDQDDVWLPDKLKRGVRALREDAAPSDMLLYCGRSWECDADLNNRRLSRGARRPAGFRHALVQNVAGGNTMILNHAALDLVRAASHEPRKLVVHDWWVYQIVTGAGGRVIFDDAPLLLYRQHAGNLIGANRGLEAKKRRLRMLVSGRFRRWNTVNISALRASAHRLTEENREVLRLFARERNRGLVYRLWMLWRTGVYRQGLQGTLSLYLAALLRRI